MARNRRLEGWTAILAIMTGAMALLLALQYCQLRIADRTQRISNRAFVFFTFQLRPYPPDNAETYAITAAVTNSGDTPAHKVSFGFRCWLADHQAAENTIDTAFQIIRRDASVMMLAPKQEKKLQACEFSPGAIAAAVSQKAALIIGEVRYIDTFDPTITRITQTAQRLNIDASRDHSFSYIGAHNCANEYCPGYESLKAPLFETVPN